MQTIQDQLDDIQEDTTMEENLDAVAEISASKQRVIGKPFVKGVSGNPNGRPPGSVSIVEGIKRKLLEIEPGNKKTYLELFLTKLFLKAIKEGNEQLMKDMINRVDGMPQQHTDLTTNGKDLPTPLLNGIHNNDSTPETTAS